MAFVTHKFLDPPCRTISQQVAKVLRTSQKAEEGKEARRRRIRLGAAIVTAEGSPSSRVCKTQDGEQHGSWSLDPETT